ncbi:ComEA family DNA-binding protein [Roseivirga sp. 4D4]|uniref:ComEA family DNA-binding protein n=1 Tax=Roseivirga sp. 4D4 TaxID=1889784 RepID=UPI001480E1BB|nr:helix-hairpin-helix domain-containing protein [Roseivirga sp. 4D4]
MNGLYAQVKREFDLQSFVEKRINDQEVGSSFEDLYERLLLAYENPIDINQIDRQGLINLGLLSSDQIQAFLEYRAANGKLNSLYELVYVSGFDLEVVKDLLPFITLSPKGLDHKPLLKRILSERNNYFILRHERVLEEKRGYANKDIPDQESYFGSPDKLYLRYRVSKPGDFSLGFTTEKDAGESIKWNPKDRNYGMDFWSGHAMLQNQGKWKKIIAGDYQLQFGQGLIFGSGFSTGKGSETINILESASIGITPYTSVVEGGFMRGLATTHVLNSKVSTTIFISSLNQDANITEASVNSESNFSTIQLTGLHRTQRELENRHQVNEKIYGIALGYHPDQRSKVGILGAFNKFSIPIQRSNQAYNLFEFSGNRNFNLGIYGSTYLQGLNFFGEAAISKSQGMGALVGFTTYLSKRIHFGFVLRNYQQDFHSIRGSAFGENSRNINENGVYWGIKYKLNRKFNLSAYYDSFHFPWLKFRVDKPSQGNDFLLRLNFNPNSITSTYLQIRGKSKDENVSLEDDTKIVATGRKLQYLMNTRYQVTSSLSLQTRIQWSSFNISDELTNGYAIIQDLNYQLLDLKVSLRHAIFDTEGQQNRQYVYERDVLYAFSIPGYSGQGVRNYLLLSYRMSTQINIWVRIARTTFHDLSEIGTGLETIDGNKRTDIKFQIRYKIR